MNTYSHNHPPLNRTELLLKTIGIVLLLTYILACCYTCATNTIQPETPWLEWKTAGSGSSYEQ